MNRKQVMGLLTVTVIVGGSLYCIKKYKETLNSETEINLEQARELLKQKDMEVREATAEVGEALGLSREEIDELIDESRDEAGWNSSFVTDTDDYDFYDGLDYNRPLSEYITEEEKVLRYNPDSIRARDQFIKMELAELLPSSPEYQLMKRLYDFNFEPLNEGDNILHSQLADYRQEFFGPQSRWNELVSFADIITHYARLIDFNIGNGVAHWITYMLGGLDIREIDSSFTIENAITRLNQHEYYNPKTASYGVFGLMEGSMRDAQIIADDTIDGEISYEIEFNEFLKNV